VTAMREASSLPVGLYCQGAAGNALAAALEAARAGADLISCAVYPVALALHRVSGEALANALAGAGLDTGVDVDALWRASELVDEYMGDEPVTPLAPRIAVRAAEHKLPAGLVAALDARLRAYAAGDRLDEVLGELTRIRSEAGWPPLAAPIGQILGSQALVHVLSASRYATVVDELRSLLEGRFGTPPGEVDPALRRAVALVAEGSEPEPELGLSELRQEAAGLAASEEELLLLALFGEEAEALLSSVRARARGDEGLDAAALDRSRAERLKEIVRVVQETGVGEITVEEAGTRVSVRRTLTEEPAPVAAPAAAPPAELLPLEEAPLPPPSDGFVRIEAPMVGTFYRAPEPGAPPFVQEGDPVAPGDTLCILEAMKLMNHVKAEIEGIVRAIHVENGEPVEFGQLLFELEPSLPRPLDAV
jgi:oxaloacetate decarboxylase alpha subunit